MKQTKVFLLTAFITLAAFGTVIYSSCKKDPCKGVLCQNGGACSGGSCSCPAGYTGAHCENSTITYQNNSYTDLNITLNGTAYVITAKSSVDFTGPAGSVLQATNVHTAGGFGEVITWSDFTDHFPINGDYLTEPFDVSAAYFFLRITNVSPYVINSLQVNYSNSYFTHEYPYLPNDGLTYDIGYYFLEGNTDVYAESGVYNWDWFPTSAGANTLFSVVAH